MLSVKTPRMDSLESIFWVGQTFIIKARVASKNNRKLQFDDGHFEPEYETNEGVILAFNDAAIEKVFESKLFAFHRGEPVSIHQSHADLIYSKVGNDAAFFRLRPKGKGFKLEYFLAEENFLACPCPAQMTHMKNKDYQLQSSDANFHREGNVLSACGSEFWYRHVLPEHITQEMNENMNRYTVVIVNYRTLKASFYTFPKPVTNVAVSPDQLVVAAVTRLETYFIDVPQD
jgi:hypothetical protein